MASARASSRRLRPADGQVGRGLVELRRQADPLRDASAAASAAARRGCAQVRADRDVLAHRLRGERLHDLEGARHAGARMQMRRAGR